jgi:hypothetical protein
MVGYTLRKKEEEIPKKALKWNPEGRRKPDRLKEPWIRTIQSEANKLFKQIGYKAKERQIWKQFTTTLCPRKGIYYYYYYYISDHVIFGFFRLLLNCSQRHKIKSI